MHSIGLIPKESLVWQVKMLHFLKLCLKSILSHSESFWGEKNSQYFVIFLPVKFFESVLTFLGVKQIFLLPEKSKHLYKLSKLAKMAKVGTGTRSRT